MVKRTGYYAGVDSGGTKCEVLLASEDLKVIHVKRYRGVHYSLAGAQKFADAVSEFISDSVKRSNLPLSLCRGICIGAAGAREDKDRNAIRKQLRRHINKPVVITTDAMTALAGSFSGGDGIILISGTGSVLYGLSGGTVYRVGGWGRILGDEGSGYWIGKRALNETVREYDEKKFLRRRSLLSGMIERDFGINAGNINSKIFNGKVLLQEIAPLVMECASRGCTVSSKIIDEAVDGLMWHIGTFMKISRRKKPINIAFTGGIIESDNLLSQELKKRISNSGIVKTVARLHSPSYGAALIAAGKFKVKKIV